MSRNNEATGKNFLPPLFLYSSQLIENQKVILIEHTGTIFAFPLVSNQEEVAMGQVVQLPNQCSGPAVYYGERLQTTGDPWTRKEKKLLDKLEFLEAMILVLDDVRLKNMRERDHGMMEVVQEEIPQYIERIEEIHQELENLRAKYSKSLLSVARG